MLIWRLSVVVKKKSGGRRDALDGLLRVNPQMIFESEIFSMLANASVETTKQTDAFERLTNRNL